MIIRKFLGYDETKTSTYIIFKEYIKAINDVLVEGGFTVDKLYEGGTNAAVSFTTQSNASNQGLEWVYDVIKNGTNGVISSSAPSLNFHSFHSFIAFQINGVKFFIGLYAASSSGFDTSGNYPSFAIFTDFRDIEGNLLENSRCMFRHYNTSNYGYMPFTFSSNAITNYRCFVELVKSEWGAFLLLRNYSQSSADQRLMIGCINWGGKYRTVYPFNKEVYLDKGSPLIPIQKVTTATAFTNLISPNYTLGDIHNGTIPTGDVYYGYEKEGILTKADHIISMPYSLDPYTDVFIGDSIYRGVPYVSNMFYKVVE